VSGGADRAERAGRERVSPGAGADRSPVRFVRDGAIARVTLDRPPVNVLDLPALERLAEVLERTAEREDVGVLCLRGRGKAFCAGVSVEDHLPERVEATLEAFRRVVEGLLELPCPAVAAVDGAALGGGCELAAACDLVLAREDAELGQPEIRLGVFPPAAAALLPRIVGRQRALELILTGRTLGADEALRAGLVQRVFPEEAFEEEVEACLAGLAGLSRPALRLAKRATREGAEGPPAEGQRAAERIYLEELAGLDDAREGLEAFLEKREPVWEHR